MVRKKKILFLIFKGPEQKTERKTLPDSSNLIWRINPELVIVERKISDSEYNLKNSLRMQGTSFQNKILKH